MSMAALGSESGHHSLNSELRVLWGQFQAGGLFVSWQGETAQDCGKWEN